MPGITNQKVAAAIRPRDAKKTGNYYPTNQVASLFLHLLTNSLGPHRTALYQGCLSFRIGPTHHQTRD